MTNKELAQKLLDLLGGKDNVLANAACMTRLRVTVKDTGNVDTEGIKALDGVTGLVEDDTMQIVLGPGKVNKVLEEFSKLTGLAKGVADESVVDAAATNKAAQKAKYESKPVQAFLKKISNVFVALLPGIIAAGLINGICNVINVSTAGALAGEWWYQGIRSMGWALFAYLPILVGYNAAREFGGSAALGGIAGMMCIANSAMPLLAPGAADPATAILLPLTNCLLYTSDAADDITLTLYRLLRQRDTITPILENQHAGIDSGGTGSRNIREIIYRLVDASVGIQVLAILHADALEIVLETVSLEMFGAIESQVLQEVSQTTLVVILIDGTHLLCNVETSYMLREIVVTNVIGQAIVEVTDSHILVNRYLWHLLCHHTTCSKQHHRCYENLL